MCHVRLRHGYILRTPGKPLLKGGWQTVFLREDGGAFLKGKMQISEPGFSREHVAVYV
jgi:hypothetical protein